MLALITIGQSPREDIVSAMFGDTEPTYLRQAGALDGLTNAEIRALRPEDVEHVLVSRLTDGREVTLSKPRLMPLVQRAVDDMVASGANVVCILCTGDFSTIDPRGARLVTPDRLVTAVVDVLLPDGKLGVLMPHADQREVMIQKWQSGWRAVLPLTYSPYSDAALPESTIRTFRDQGIDLVVMDCMGYTGEMYAAIQAALDVPVILSNRLTGAILREIALGSPISDPLQV